MESSSPSVFVNSSKEGIARVKVRISEEEKMGDKQAIHSSNSGWKLCIYDGINDARILYGERLSITIYWRITRLKGRKYSTLIYWIFYRLIYI